MTIMAPLRTSVDSSSSLVVTFSGHWAEKCFNFCSSFLFFFLNFFFLNYSLCLSCILISPISCPIASIFPLHLSSLRPCTALPNKTKVKRRKGKGKRGEIKHLIMEGAVWHSESHNVPFFLYIYTCRCSLQRAIGLIWGLWFPLHYWYWTLTGPLLG